MTEKSFKELLKKLNISKNISYAERKELLEAKLSEYIDRQDEETEEMVSEIQDALVYVEELIKKMRGGITLYSLEKEEKEPETINIDLLKEAAGNKKKGAENFNADTNTGSFTNSNLNAGHNVQSGVNTKGKAWFYSTKGDKNVDDMFELAEGDLRLGDYSHALSVFDTILNIEMTNAGAYMGKVLATYQLREPKDLAVCTESGIEQDNNLKRAEQCGSDRQKKYIQDALEERRKYSIYLEAERILTTKDDTTLLQDAAKKFDGLGAYRDASEKADECRNKCNEIVYQKADKILQESDESQQLLEAAETFEGLGEYRDASVKANECKIKCLNVVYEEADKILQEESNPKRLLEAIGMFEGLGDYRDASEKAEKCRKHLDIIKIELLIKEKIRKRRLEEWKKNEQ